jgi:CPA2 family monovalent cation:H+ antiporter-2
LLAGLLFAFIGIKLGVFYGAARLFDLTREKSARTSILLAQGGEFAFVIFGLALQNKVIAPETVTMYSSVVIFSMILTPFLVRLSWPVLEVEPTIRDDANMVIDEGFSDRRDHVVIAGFGRVGEVVAQMLAAQKVPFIAIDDRHERVAQARSKELPVFYGDASKPHVLRSVGVENARAVVVAVSSSRMATDIVYTLREHWPDVPIFGRARDNEHAKILSEAGVQVTVPITLNSSIELGGALLQNIGFSADNVDRAATIARKSFS